MLINTAIYLTVERWDDGNMINGDGHVAALSIDGVVDHLAAAQDDGRTIEIVCVRWSEIGIPEAEVVTEAVARHMAERLRLEDVEEGLPPSYRPWAHPLIETHTDFEWRMTPLEREDARSEQQFKMEREDEPF